MSDSRTREEMKYRTMEHRPNFIQQMTQQAYNTAMKQDFWYLMED
jgi:hypothetical protein